MPDIDPGALGRLESAANGSATPLISSKSLPGASGSTQKTGKPSPAIPRVDVEPIYAALKTAIGEHWNRYKDAISRFVLGTLSQQELARFTDPYILPNSQTERLHNQLICAIYANATREPPEQGVAVWVSTNEKPAVPSKPVAGDAAEMRLKAEVMHLPPRVRHRLKTIQDEPFNPITHSILVHTQSKRVLPTSTNTTNPTSATATTSTGLNTDLEIRKRYHIPLATESRDLPPQSSLADRLAPICYEEGLPSGPASPGPCVDLLSTGLETFIKEVVTGIIARSRTNAPVSGPEHASSLAPPAVPITTSTSSTLPLPVPLPSQQPMTTTNIPILTATVGLGPTTAATGIKTASYKRRLAAEELASLRGDLKRSETGLLPCEITSADRHGNGIGGDIATQGDLRLAWDMDEPLLAGLMPWLGERIAAAEYTHFPFGAEEGWEEQLDDAVGGGVAESAAAGAGVDRMDVDGYDDPTAASSTRGNTTLARTKSAHQQTKANGFSAAAAAPGGVAGAGGSTMPDAGGDRDAGDAMAIDEPPDWEWQGAGSAERAVLGALLDDCLAVGV